MGLYSYVLLAFQLSFQMWTKQMQEMLDARRKGDLAFNEKKFAVAIERYSEVSCQDLLALFFYIGLIFSNNLELLSHCLYI